MEYIEDYEKFVSYYYKKKDDINSELKKLENKKTANNILWSERYRRNGIMALEDLLDENDKITSQIKELNEEKKYVNGFINGFLSDEDNFRSVLYNCYSSEQLIDVAISVSKDKQSSLHRNIISEINKTKDNHNYLIESYIPLKKEFQDRNNLGKKEETIEYILNNNFNNYNYTEAKKFFKKYEPISLKNN